MKRLSRNFFARPAEIVAKDLLGKILVRKLSDNTFKKGFIMETEAYIGVEDLASHAAGGRKTKRNEVMYGPAGVAYVYFTYGMHWLLNVITGEAGDPQGVLVRGLDVVSGPARLTKFLEIDGSFNGEDLIVCGNLWVEEGMDVDLSKVKTTPRIGVDYAKEWKDKPLRFVLEQ